MTIEDHEKRKIIAKPRVVMHGLINISILKPKVAFNYDEKTFSITYFLNDDTDPEGFKLYPLGNEILITYDTTEIYRTKIDLWILPNTVKKRHESMGNTLIFEGQLFPYNPM